MARQLRRSTNRPLVEIVVSHGETIFDVKHLRGRLEYRVGEAPTADFVLGPIEGSTALVRERGGLVEITIPPGFCCPHRPHARPGDVLVLAADERLSVCRDALRFDIRWVSAERLAGMRPRLDRPFLASLIATFVCAAVFFAFMRATPEDPVARQEQLERAAVRLADYSDAGSGGHTKLPGPRSEKADPSQERVAGIASARGKHEVGKRGSARPRRDATTQGTGASPRGGEGLDRNASPAAAAREVGLLGLLAASEDYQAFVGAGSGDWDGGPADGAMWASAAGLAGDGSEGLSLAGTGRGGGGLASGVAGLANASVLTPTGGSGSLTSSDAPAFGGRDRRTPRTIICMLMVQGALDRDLIRRVIRAHENEVRSCYNQALVDRPMLAGRITVDFTLTPSGQVGSAVVSADEVHDEQLRSCIVRAVKRWKFPAVSHGGSSIVSYTYDLRVE